MGSFVVIEGLDGAGTTTQAARLVSRLRARGAEVLDTHEPTDGPIGRRIRACLRREEGAPARASLPWLYAADRADHLARFVEPMLHEGGWVVSDRYLHSSLAYQSLDVPLDYVAMLNERFRAPDLTIFLHAPVEVCLGRIGGRGEVREIFEERAALERISVQYDTVLSLLEGKGQRIERVDATGSVEAIETRIAELVDSL